MPELSIIVPVYKVEKYLPKCIDSILAQTFRDFELILIDDGSPDNCGAICDDYAARDSRIKVIHQKNAGVSAARNAGLDIATGTYLGFVDSDDWIEPEMYAAMIATMQETQADVVACGIDYRSENGEFIRNGLTADQCYQESDVLACVYGTPNPLGGGCCNKLFCRNVVRTCRFPKGISLAEDWLYLFESLRLCVSCRKISESYYHVTERLDSASRSENPGSLFRAVTSSRLMLELAQTQAPELKNIAINKFLDDCVRYGRMIRQIGQKNCQPYRMYIFRIQWQMSQLILYASMRKLLPKSKLRGYIMGMIKL